MSPIRPLGRIQRSPNPCVDVYGPGPAGARCKTCASLSQQRGYFKCALRAESRGAKTDHRANWPACRKYEAAA